MIVNLSLLSQAELQQLQSQQAQLLQITQSARSLLDQPDSTVPPEEKQRLRAALDQLQAEHQERLQSCQVLKINANVYFKILTCLISSSL